MWPYFQMWLVELSLEGGVFNPVWLVSLYNREIWAQRQMCIKGRAHGKAGRRWSSPSQGERYGADSPFRALWKYQACDTFISDLWPPELRRTINVCWLSYPACSTLAWQNPRVEYVLVRVIFFWKLGNVWLVLQTNINEITQPFMPFLLHLHFGTPGTYPNFFASFLLS